MYVGNWKVMSKAFTAVEYIYICARCRCGWVALNIPENEFPKEFLPDRAMTGIA